MRVGSFGKVVYFLSYFITLYILLHLLYISSCYLLMCYQLIHGTLDWSLGLMSNFVLKKILLVRFVDCLMECLYVEGDV